MAVISCFVMASGPPDAPLDVQLEQGPSPGIALISWLPVTIDAAGTSNGVRVTGYSIYVDRKKVGTLIYCEMMISLLHDKKFYDLFSFPRSWRYRPPQRAVPCWAPLRCSACRPLRSSLSALCPLTGSPVTLCQLRCPPSWLPSWQARLSLPP